VRLAVWEYETGQGLVPTRHLKMTGNFASAKLRRKKLARSESVILLSMENGLNGARGVCAASLVELPLESRFELAPSQNQAMVDVPVLETRKELRTVI
jgi:hypothetical protein